MASPLSVRRSTQRQPAQQDAAQVASPPPSSGCSPTGYVHAARGQQAQAHVGRLCPQHREEVIHSLQAQLISIRHGRFANLWWRPVLLQLCTRPAPRVDLSQEIIDVLQSTATSHMLHCRAQANSVRTHAAWNLQQGTWQRALASRLSHAQTNHTALQNMPGLLVLVTCTSSPCESSRTRPSRGNNLDRRLS